MGRARVMIGREGKTPVYGVANMMKRENAKSSVNSQKSELHGLSL